MRKMRGKWVWEEEMKREKSGERELLRKITWGLDFGERIKSKWANIFQLGGELKSHLHRNHELSFIVCGHCRTEGITCTCKVRDILRFCKLYSCKRAFFSVIFFLIHWKAALFDTWRTTRYCPCCLSSIKAWYAALGQVK